jgi:thymidylate synthase ThyX
MPVSTSISAKVLADTWFAGSRLTTFELVYPRFILAEVNTHRQFSRNSASSRAIPVEAMIAAVEADPAGPVFWGKNQAGMSAAEELQGDHLQCAKDAWRSTVPYVVGTVKHMAALGLHKQIANRVLEPWVWVKTVLSATEWANFYALRTAAGAQPEFQALAEAMLAAHNASTPYGYDIAPEAMAWHLPYITAEERLTLSIKDQKKVSVARCARVSYTRHGQVKDLEDDRRLHDRLAASGHWSPFEHVATPFRGKWANFKNFMQYRYEMSGENIQVFPRLLDPFRDRSVEEVKANG